MKPWMWLLLLWFQCTLKIWYFLLEWKKKKLHKLIVENVVNLIMSQWNKFEVTQPFTIKTLYFFYFLHENATLKYKALVCVW